MISDSAQLEQTKKFLQLTDVYIWSVITGEAKDHSLRDEKVANVNLLTGSFFFFKKKCERLWTFNLMRYKARVSKKSSLISHYDVIYVNNINFSQISSTGHW